MRESHCSLELQLNEHSSCVSQTLDIQSGENLTGEQVPQLTPAPPQAPPGIPDCHTAHPRGHLQPCSTINAALSALHKTQYADPGNRTIKVRFSLALNAFLLLAAHKSVVQFLAPILC